MDGFTIMSGTMILSFVLLIIGLLICGVLDRIYRLLQSIRGQLINILEKEHENEEGLIVTHKGWYDELGNLHLWSDPP